MRLVEGSMRVDLKQGGEKRKGMKRKASQFDLKLW